MEPEVVVQPEKKEEEKMAIEKNVDRGSTNPSRPQVFEDYLISDYFRQMT
mgnify:CR=1 FL=1